MQRGEPCKDAAVAPRVVSGGCVYGKERTLSRRNADGDAGVTHMGARDEDRAHVHDVVRTEMPLPKRPWAELVLCFQV